MSSASAAPSTSPATNRPLGRVNPRIIMHTNLGVHGATDSRVYHIDVTLTEVYNRIADAAVFDPSGPNHGLTQTVIECPGHPGVDIDAWWYETTMPYVLRVVDDSRLVRQIIDKAFAWLAHDHDVRAHNYRLRADAISDGVRLAALLPTHHPRDVMERLTAALDILLADAAREICERARMPLTGSMWVTVPCPGRAPLGRIATRVAEALLEWGPPRGLLAQRILDSRAPSGRPRHNRVRHKVRVPDGGGVGPTCRCGTGDNRCGRIGVFVRQVNPSRRSIRSDTTKSPKRASVLRNPSSQPYSNTPPIPENTLVTCITPEFP